MNPVLLALITGLTTGGLSCLAVHGGLLASSLAQKEEEKLLPDWQKVGLFLAAKLAVYTLLGFGLGLLGSRLAISPIVQGWMQIAAGLFMLATALRILDVNPIFRYFVIEPPRWAYRAMRRQTADTSFFAPLVLGSMTVFIPCGVTQAMMVASIATGNPVLAAAIMFAFTLGTSPVFFVVGSVAAKFLEKKLFAYTTAVVIATLGVLSINTGQALRGSIYTLQNFYKAATTDIYAQKAGKVAGINTEGKQEATVNVSSYGYSSSVRSLKTGIPVKLTLQTKNTQGCTRAFTIPSLGVSKVLPQTGTEVLEFTPTKTGTLAYSCSMGMYTGSFTVVN